MKPKAGSVGIALDLSVGVGGFLRGWLVWAFTVVALRMYATQRRARTMAEHPMIKDPRRIRRFEKVLAHRTHNSINGMARLIGTLKREPELMEELILIHNNFGFPVDSTKEGQADG